MVRDAKQKADLIASATHRQECSERNACDVELLSVGGFSPLTGFMNKDVYDHVVDNMRCAHANVHYLGLNLLAAPSGFGLGGMTVLIRRSRS